jgi:FdhD protein
MHKFVELQGIKYTMNGKESVMDKIIREAEVDLTVNGAKWMTFLCTPEYLEALAVGFLFNEGVISSARELASVRVCPEGDNVDVWLNHQAEQAKTWRRTSGCSGGRAGEDSGMDHPVADHPSPISTATINRMMTLLYDSQGLHQETGGTHSTALSDGNELVLHIEDIGRHNTLDKIAGEMLLKEILKCCKKQPAWNPGSSFRGQPRPTWR